MSHEAISVFDMFKIGVGLKQPYTWPLAAAAVFYNPSGRKNILQEVKSIEVLLYGSLAKTGKAMVPIWPFNLG